MKSMTGYGSGEAGGGPVTVVVEIRSVNSRFLDLSLRYPPELSSRETNIRGHLQRAVSRGKVQVAISLRVEGDGPTGYRINHGLLTQLEQLAASRGESISLAALLQINGVVERDAEAGNLEAIDPVLEEAITAALAVFQERRWEEGEVLRNALEKLRFEAEEALARINSARTRLVEDYQIRLSERLNELLTAAGNPPVDPQRLAQEVAILADRTDLSEELVRLGAHLAKAKKLLSDKQDKPLGKELEFLQQEMLRETNTIGSKAKDLAILDDVLRLKSLLESFREQVANVE